MIDKSHLVLTESDYRPSLVALRALRQFETQFILLSATLPPSLISELERIFFLKGPLVVRKETTRQNLRLAVTTFPFQEYESQIKKFQDSESKGLQAKERVICYT